MSIDKELEESWGYIDPRRRLSLTERRRAYLPALVAAAERELFDLDRACSFTCSPIEELFMAALWVKVPANIVVEANGDSAVHKTQRPGDPWTVFVRPQCSVGPYRVDFLLSLEGSHVQESSRLAVEVDGHDFHEKTKAQAAHDKKRDRFFASEGLTVIRFTGSEITKNAHACATEAEVLLGKLLRARAP